MSTVTANACDNVHIALDAIELASVMSVSGNGGSILVLGVDGTANDKVLHVTAANVLEQGCVVSFTYNVHVDGVVLTVECTVEVCYHHGGVHVNVTFQNYMMLITVGVVLCVCVYKVLVLSSVSNMECTVLINCGLNGNGLSQCTFESLFSAH